MLGHIFAVQLFPDCGENNYDKQEKHVAGKISFIFLVPRDDVSQTRRLTEDGNEHFYVLWRMILREFNMEKLIRIVQKSIINIQAMFDSGLVTSRSNILFKGYQQSFPDFIEN